MSTPALDPSERERLEESLFQTLFAPGDAFTYAILDGASVEDLLPQLEQEQTDSVCLYRGDLSEEPGLAEAAPYLVLLQPESALTKWIIQRGWGQHWGIFFHATDDLRALRKHFRTFLMVQNPQGESMYFRYYDPRVLRIYLPMANRQEVQAVYGPIRSYLMEGDDPTTLLSWENVAGSLQVSTIPLLTRSST